MKKAGLSLVLAAVLALAGCAEMAQGASPSGSASLPDTAAGQPKQSESASQAQPASSSEFEYRSEALALVNGALEDYASGVFPEPMRYNTDYSGINNSPPVDSALPQSVGADDVTYDRRSGELVDTVVATLELENDYTMDIHMEMEGASGRPLRVTGIHYYDMQGSGQAEYAAATHGGEFLRLKSDRLFASADFENVRTDAGMVSGSISWGKANRFLWIDIDSMKEPFYYTYYVVDGEGLVQDYPQKEWQQYTVIHDEKMMTIAQSLYEQLCTALGDSGLLV